MTIRGSAGESTPNTYQNSSDWTATWTYTDGDWRGTCEGTWSMDWDDHMDGFEDSSGTFSRTFTASHPPHWPLFNTRDPPSEGEPVDAWVMWDCTISAADMLYSGVDDGYHRADDEPVAEENYSDFTTHWDTRTGLVYSWSWSRTNSGTSGSVTSTDAPGAP